MGAVFTAIVGGGLNEWSSNILSLRVAAAAAAAVVLHNHKITDNSSETHPCLFASPRAPSALVYQLMY